jgi:polyhydroxyalkanoate synthesis regulator phasin
MNKHYRLPLRTRPKNVSTAVRWRRGSPSLLTTGLIALGGLAALFAIGFATFFAYQHFSHNAAPVAVAAPPISTTPSPVATPLVAATDVLRPLADPNQLVSPVPSPTVATGPKESSTPSLPPVAAPASGGLAAQAGQKGDTSPENATKTSSKAARKSLEKKRQAAERKRARLEQMYQNHEISTVEYNKGEQEYKDEIQKYRKEISPGPQ